jgi:hypothetical protein
MLFIIMFTSTSGYSLIDKVIDSDKNVRKEIIDLLAETNPEIILPDNKLATIIKPTQDKWIRQGQIRWEKSDLDDNLVLGQKIDNVLAQLNLKDPIAPKNTDHAFVAIFGGTVESMTLRVAHLRDRIEAHAFSGKVLLFGSSSDCSLYLGGIRTLMELHPDWFLTNNTLPETTETVKITETGVLSFLAENFLTPLGVTYKVIDMPDVTFGDQRTRKANTNDQAIMLKELTPNGSVLFVSNDDLGIRQGIVLETVFSKDVLDLAIFREEYGTTIREVFQSAGSAQLTSTLKLDNLARLLYQIQSSIK